MRISPLRRLLFTAAGTAGTLTVIAASAWLVGLNVPALVSNAMVWITPAVTLASACLLVAVTRELLAIDRSSGAHDDSTSQPRADRTSATS